MLLIFMGGVELAGPMLCSLQLIPISGWTALSLSQAVLHTDRVYTKDQEVSQVLCGQEINFVIGQITYRFGILSQFHILRTKRQGS